MMIGDDENGRPQAGVPASPPGSRWRVQARVEDQMLQVSDKGVFDELVVDSWLHVEQMDENSWCLRVGDARLHVTILADGTAETDVQRGFYADVRGETSTHDVPR